MTTAAASRTTEAVPARVILVLFVTTLLVSSLLMFLVEPMAAKMLLPLLGGAPAVWNTCVVFFQAMLLIGYAYAHGAPRWLGLRSHAVLHAVLLLVPFANLPFAIGAGPPTSGRPVFWLLTVLLASIGAPFFVLTTTAPLLQKWFSATDHPSASDPYFLYAASNLGSLAGLLMYPGVVEPLLRLRTQVVLWSVGYALFAGLAIACTVVLLRHQLPVSSSVTAAPTGKVGWPRRLRWAALAFAPSSLMLAVTTFVSTDIAPVPLLWVVPLALYLLTFIVAFNPPVRYPRTLVDKAFPLLVLPVIFPMVLQGRGSAVVTLPAYVHMIAFFVVALVCHRELADDRPASSNLTAFYFWVAFGGVLGSLFNTLVAPVLFTAIVEYPIALVLACLLRSGHVARRADGQPKLYGIALAAGVVTLVLLTISTSTQNVTLRLVLLSVPAFLCLRVSRSRGPFAAAVSFMLLAAMVPADTSGTVLHSERTFFGIYRVRTERDGSRRSLSHGTTLHGMQNVAPDRAPEPLTYYHRTGPFGDINRSVSAASSYPRIAVVGLGVGSLAAYRSHDQTLTFYEIDPAVERIARRVEFFSFLNQCGERCRVVIGDARLSLAAATEDYGIIALDAFSSDAIPVHLMTREAVLLYLSKLAPHGVLAFHISNRHLDLEPVLGRIAHELQLVTLIRRERVSEQESKQGKSSSDWLVMARGAEDVRALSVVPHWVPARSAKARTWTDDFSNILSVMAR